MTVTDITVIGGGPAGLAAAIAARRKGCDVTVIDCADAPADKACGEGLMPDALAALGQLGVQMGAADSFPFRGIRFHDRGRSVAASFPVGLGRGVRRTTLHRILADHAAAVGVKLCWRTFPDLGSLRCRWIVGADGENSMVRKWAGLDRRIYDRRRFGFRRHYRIAPWSDYMELYWGAAGQIYVTPVSAEAVCVAAISRDASLRLDAALEGFPNLAARLGSAPILSAERGAVTASRRLKAVYRGHVALVGDASGSVDAITGEGLCLAFRQAVALADVLEQGDLAPYQRQHADIARRAEWMARFLVSFGDRAMFRRTAMRVMSACPGLFAKMLAAHVGAIHENNTHPLLHADGRLVWSGGDAGARSGPNPGTVHAE